MTKKQIAARHAALVAAERRTAGRYSIARSASLTRVETFAAAKARRAHDAAAGELARFEREHGLTAADRPHSVKRTTP